MVTQSSQSQVPGPFTLSRRAHRAGPDTSAPDRHHLGKMFHLSISIFRLPPPGARRPHLAARRAARPRRPRTPAGAAEADPAVGTTTARRRPRGRGTRRAVRFRLPPPQPYTERRSPDVTPQRPVQRPARRPANRPPRAARAPGSTVTAARAGPGGPAPPSGRGLGFTVSCCRFSHHPGCFRLALSSRPFYLPQRSDHRAAPVNHRR
jgi:hypothetical protein